MARRRLRVNGRVTRWAPDAVEVAVTEAYGNCPRHIHRRRAESPRYPEEVTRTRHRALLPAQQDRVRRADTVFIGTCHPTTGADASHRGGPPGFVHVAGPDRLVIPDYSG